VDYCRILAVHSCEKKCETVYKWTDTCLDKVYGSIRKVTRLDPPYPSSHQCAAGRDAVRIGESQREQLPTGILPSSSPPSSSFQPKNRWPMVMWSVPRRFWALPQNCSSSQ